MNQNDVAIVTGANSGMGREISLELAKTGAAVVMLCRSRERGESALAYVRNKSNNERVGLMVCDLGSLKEIRAFCYEFTARYGRLTVLVNNAGVIVPKRQLTADGFELQFGVNHLGHFLLTNLLLDLLKKSAPSRIVNVASGAHKIGRIHFDDINLEKGYTTFGSYAQSKLANILFTYELARRLAGTSVTANCLHPGAVATSMGVDRKTGFGTFITGLLRPFFQTAAKGAETAVYLAVSKEVEGVSGKYYYKEKQIRSSTSSYDPNLAMRLWTLSGQLTGIHTEEHA